MMMTDKFGMELHAGDKVFFAKNNTIGRGTVIATTNKMVRVQSDDDVWYGQDYFLDDGSIVHGTFLISPVFVAKR